MFFNYDYNREIKKNGFSFFSLLFTKVKLEEALFGPAAALQTCEEMLQEWQSRYDVSRSRRVGNTCDIVVIVLSLKKQAFQT